MTSVLEPLTEVSLKIDRKPVVLRRYFCRCGRPVFFRNSVCLACKTPLGYEPHLRQVFALAPGSQLDTWELASEDASSGTYLRCANLETPAACNWLIPEVEAEGNPSRFCIACRLDRTIP